MRTPVIEALKAPIRRRWPRLRLRSILLLTFVFVAALPGVGALFLRVYENTLVRQTEAELIAQGAALAATAAADWPGAPPLTPPAGYAPEPPTIDLRETPVLPERPPPLRLPGSPSPAADAAAARLRPILQATARTTLASAMLLDADGRILIGPEAGSSEARLPEVRAALTGHPATVLRRNGAYRARYPLEWLSRASDLRIHHARPIIVGGKVVGVLLLSRSPRALFRGIYEDRGKIAFGVAAIFVMLIVLSGLLSRGIARPIEALSEATREVARGRGVVPAPPATAAVEIQALYADLAAMAAVIERRSRYLRDFAHAVSHEFKTPLTGIRGALELIREHGDTMARADSNRFLVNASADADRLAQLVTRLLELARADMTQANVDASADVMLVLRRVADALSSDTLGIDVAAPADLPPAAVSGDVVEVAVTSLVENSRQAGARRVSITVAPEAGHLRVTVSDDGPGVAAADRSRIFEPFFTNRRATGGTGLGLPIARSLLTAYGGRIDLDETAAHMSFDLILPVAMTRSDADGAQKRPSVDLLRP